MTVSLKSLACFRAIMDAGSVTSAAQQLKVTQPAVSRMLGQLESDIGFELFTRTKGKLVPTDAAFALFNEVEIALQSVDRVSQLAVNLKNHDYGELSIVAPPSFAERVVTRLIAEFLKLHPNIRISLDSRNIETAQDMVALRAVDCGFVRLPVEHPDISSEKLVSAGTACVMSAKHPLAGRSCLKAEDLAGQPLIMLGRGRASRLVLNQGFESAQVRPTVRVETHTVSAACALARQGAGIAIVNEMLAAQYIDRRLAICRFSPSIRHDYAFMTSANAPMTRVTKKFREFCRSFFIQYPDPASWSPK